MSDPVSSSLVELEPLCLYTTDYYSPTVLKVILTDLCCSWTVEVSRICSVDRELSGDDHCDEHVREKERVTATPSIF